MLLTTIWCRLLRKYLTLRCNVCVLLGVTVLYSLSCSNISLILAGIFTFLFMGKHLQYGYKFQRRDPHMNDTISTTITAIGTGFMATLLGSWDMALEILLIVIALDYITGIMSAFKQTDQTVL